MGIHERLENIEKILEDKNEEKPKKFKLPFFKKVSAGKKRKNYVTLLKINENGGIDFKKIQISEQAFIEEGIPRIGSAEYILHWKKNPFIILPSWSTKPFSPSEQYEKSLNDGSNTKGYKILMSKMLSEQVGAKKQMGSMIKWILGIGLVGIVAYAFLGGG